MTLSFNEIFYIIIPLIAIAISIYTFVKTRKIKYYTDLDLLYFKLLKIGIDNPKFRNPKYTNNYKKMFKGNELYKYETYAYLSWNLCETVYDRKSPELLETWNHLISYENKLHRSWFDNPENHFKYKDDFRNYINKNFKK